MSSTKWEHDLPARFSSHHVTSRTPTSQKVLSYFFCQFLSIGFAQYPAANLTKSPWIIDSQRDNGQ